MIQMDFAASFSIIHWTIATRKELKMTYFSKKTI